jgi:hypothetical protein
LDRLVFDVIASTRAKIRDARSQVR